MLLTVTTEDDKIVAVDVDPDTVVENLKAIIEAETDVPSGTQAVVHNGRELRDADVLGPSGVKDGDLLMVLRRPAAGASNPMALGPDGAAVDPAAFQRQIRTDAHLMQQLRTGNPPLHAAILSPDTTQMQALLRQAHEARDRAEAARKAEIDLLNADPFDMEAQRKIEEAIRLKNVDENYEHAMETTPEAFGSVIMLYVDMEVNGHPLKVFVDSGAQMTIMSLGCAQRLGLERLIDRRFQGWRRVSGPNASSARCIKPPSKSRGCSCPAPSPCWRRSRTWTSSSDWTCSSDTSAASTSRRTSSDLDPSRSRCRSWASTSSPPSPRRTGRRKPRGGRRMPGGGAGAVSSGGPGGAGEGAGAGDADEAKVAKLVELGFDRDKCEEALRASGGNEEYAASLLFGGF